MLGSCFLILGVPTTFGISMVAVLQRAPDRVFAIIALVLSSLELGLLGLSCAALLFV